MFKKIGWRGILIAGVAICYFGYLHFNGKTHSLSLQTQSSESNPLKNEVHLTTEQVSSVMYREGIRLSPLIESSKIHDLGGVHPSVFKINNDKTQRLYVYDFQSTKERQKYSDDIQSRLINSTYEIKPIFKKDNLNSPLTSLSNVFSSWNILFIQSFPIPRSSQTKSKNIDLEPIIFHDLNGGETKTYNGENAYWKATFTYNYYEHWWKDNEGNLQNEIKGQQGFFVATYKDQLPIKNVLISYQLPGQGGTTQTPILAEKTTKIRDNEMTSPIGTFEPKMTFNWNHKKSTLTLHLKRVTSKK